MTACQPTARAAGATILAFDCSGAAASAAILRAGRVLAALSEPMERGQGERLLPLLRDAMAEAGLDFTRLDAIAVTVGPGRFTGLRIGIAAARGLALAAAKPALGIGSFAAIAAAARETMPATAALLAVIDSRREELFAQRFDAKGAALGEPRVAVPAAIAAELPPGPLLVAGDGAELMRPALAGRAADSIRFLPGPIRADIVARLADEALAGSSALPPRPIYLRAPDAKLPTPVR